MQSSFSKLTQPQEESGKGWQTVKIRESPQAHIDCLVHIAAAIQTHFINMAEWERHVNEGSLTFQRKNDPHQVISVFIDNFNDKKKRRLSEEYPIPPLDPCTIVVGIELTYTDPYLRMLIRKDLKTRFAYYMEPDPSGQNKRWLAPKEPLHLFDILFLECGECPYQPDEAILSAIQEEVQSVL